MGKSFVESIDFSSPWVIIAIVIAAFFLDDMTSVLVGSAVAAGKVSLLPAIGACLLGIHLGDLAWFLSARFAGQPLLKIKPFSLIVTPDKIEQARGLFDRLGPWALFASRFMPLARTPLQVTSGLLLRRHLLTCCGLLLLAAGTYAVLVVGGVAWLGKLFNFEAWYEQYGGWALLAVPVISFGFMSIGRWSLRRLTRGTQQPKP